LISQRLLKNWYPDDRKNGTKLFYSWVREHVAPNSTILNVGAGPASRNPVKTFRGEVARVVGIDIDPVVLTNEDLDEAFVSDGMALPFGDCSFDIVLSDYVFEHVEFPGPFLREIHRVLKPGGSLFFRTPNKFHYVSLIGRCTPHWFHSLVANRVRGMPSDAHEPYETHYRLNSTADIRGLAARAKFSQVDLRYVECEPSYLMFSTIPFLAGVLYERTVNHFNVLSGIRANIFGRLVR
jgi:SAM-dependent methyltransferase